MSQNRGSVLEQVVRAVVAGHQSAVTDRELLDRFVRDNNQDAFRELVHRHGGMVLDVCRRTLPRVQDAEDACQATFLVLTRKAGSVSWGPSVANWLYVTARKVARNARVAAERRARREAVAAVHEIALPVDELSARELLAVLDEELGKLPSRYREPLVLCHLEGLTRDEAAERLGVPVATIKSRLERGRKKLGDALTKRGMTLGAGLLAVAVGTTAGAFSPRLVESILTVTAGTLPASVCDLARTVAIHGAPNKLVRFLVALIGIVGVGVALGAINANTDLAVGAAEEMRGDSPIVDPKQNVALPEPSVRSTKKGENPGEMVTYRGRVLSPDGKPVPGARLHVMTWRGTLTQTAPVPESTRADEQGRFELKVPKEPSMDVLSVVIGATAPTHGAGWVEVQPKGKCDDLTVHLVNDNAPITGQIVTLEGKPVAGATITVVQIYACLKEDLGPWLEAIKATKGDDDLEFRYFSRFAVGMSPRVTTDKEGRFKLRGIGPNRLVILRLEGPTITTRHLRVLTRAGESLRVLRWEADPQFKRAAVFVTYYGTNFRYPATPTKPIVGIVRDKNTKKPLAGVTIRNHTIADPESEHDYEYVVQTTTDKDGRYRLVGMPAGEGNRIAVIASTAGPYLVSASDVPHTPGLEPVTVDFELKRGIWIEGKITDKVTGQPVWVDVEYFALAKNPNLDEQPGFARLRESIVETKADGSYRIAGLPGSGYIVVGRTTDHLQASERDDEFGRTISDRLFTVPMPLERFSNFCAVASLEPKVGVDTARRDVTLDPGWTFQCRVLGLDGKPLAGVRAYGVSNLLRWTDKVDTGEITVRCFNPRRPRDLIFQQLEKGLVGVATPPKENGGVVTVQMERGATVTGRLLGADGKPRPNVAMKLWISTKQTPHWEDYAPPTVQTDKDGRFRIEGLVPGFRFKLRDEPRTFQFGEGLRSGVVKDLGDVRTAE